MKVRLLPSDREFEARRGEPVLTAALRQHLNLPHSCKGGSCGTCRVRVLRGQFDYPHGRPIGIDAAEEAAGYALICQARAASDLVVEIREIRHVTDVEIRELPARVERMERFAPDVMGLWLRLPAIEPFTWQAGQYVDVMLAGERRRSFSLANPPRDAALLELHVRRTPGGAFSEQVFGGMKSGSLLRIEGRKKRLGGAHDSSGGGLGGGGDRRRADQRQHADTAAYSCGQGAHLLFRKLS